MKGNLPILIIEDQTRYQELIKAAILENQIKNPTYFAHTSSEASDYLSSINYHPSRDLNRLPGVIILNYHLEGDISLRLLGSLKKDPVYQQIPIIMFSASDAEEDMDACYAVGCNGYFTMPQNGQEFTNVIKVIYDFWLHAAAIPYFLEKA